MSNVMFYKFKIKKYLYPVFKDKGIKNYYKLLQKITNRNFE